MSKKTTLSLESIEVLFTGHESRHEEIRAAYYYCWNMFYVLRVDESYYAQHALSDVEYISRMSAQFARCVKETQAKCENEKMLTVRYIYASALCCLKEAFKQWKAENR